MILKLHKSIKTSTFAFALTFMFFLIFILIDFYIDVFSASNTHLRGELIAITIYIIFTLLGLIFYYKTINPIFLELSSDILHIEDLNKVLTNGVSEKVQKQFLEWGLTKSEIYIGYLLLKGFSLKEISQLRDISVNTVREHCSNIYRKTKLKNRVELSSFFLEDFLSMDVLEEK